MYRRTLSILLIIFFCGPAFAANLEKINIIEQNREKINIIFAFKDEAPKFNYSQKNQEIIIYFKETKLANGIPSINDKNINSIDFLSERNNLLVKIKTRKQLTIAGTKKLKDRIIIELSKKENFSNKTKGFPYQLPPTPSEIIEPFTNLNYTGEKISVDFQNADIKSVICFISEAAGVNLVLGENITGKVTLKLKNVPWDQVLDIIMARFGLGRIKINNVIYIASISELQTRVEQLKELKKTISEEQESAPLITEYITTNYINACDLLTEFSSTRVQKTRPLKGQGETGTQGSSAESSIEAKTETKGVITPLLSARGTVSCDPRTSTLIVRDTKESIEAIKELIARLDKPNKQVLIEARIVEVASNFARNLGIQWFGGYYKAKGKEKFLVSPSTRVPQSVSENYYQNEEQDTKVPAFDASLPPFGPIVDLGVPATSALGFAIGRITQTSAILLDVRLSALEEEGQGRIVSSPRIITHDNEPAIISQGYRIPYLELTSEGTATTKFIDADLVLKVVPHILPNNEIKLRIDVNKSEPDWAREVNGVPAIIKRTAQTFLRVPNGGTVVIGGLKIAKKQESYGRVPGLSKIPAVGNLFKNSLKNQEEQELIIFITSKVISSAVEEIDY